MKAFSLGVLVSLAVAAFAQPRQDYPVQPVAFTSVKLADSF